MSEEKIKVKVKLVGNLRKYGEHIKEMEVPEGTTLKDMAEGIGIPEEEEITSMVNEGPKYMHYKPEEGDSIDFLRVKS